MEKSRADSLLLATFPVGILGFMRAIAGHCQIIDGIRVNALLPGAVKTPILEWGDFPEDAFTPPELIAEVVFKLAAGEEIVDSKGAKIPTEKAYGQAVIVTGKKYYIHPETEYCDVRTLLSFFLSPFLQSQIVVGPSLCAPTQAFFAPEGGTSITISCGNP